MKSAREHCKIGIKSRAGPGNSILNTEVFDITSKVNVHFN